MTTYRLDLGQLDTLARLRDDAARIAWLEDEQGVVPNKYIRFALVYYQKSAKVTLQTLLDIVADRACLSDLPWETMKTVRP